MTLPGSERPKQTLTPNCFTCTISSQGVDLPASSHSNMLRAHTAGPLYPAGHPTTQLSSNVCVHRVAGSHGLDWRGCDVLLTPLRTFTPPLGRGGRCASADDSSAPVLEVAAADAIDATAALAAAATGPSRPESLITPARRDRAGASHRCVMARANALARIQRERCAANGRESIPHATLGITLHTLAWVGREAHASNCTAFRTIRGALRPASKP